MYKALALLWLALSVVGCATNVVSPSPQPEATNASPPPSADASPTRTPSTDAPRATAAPTASAIASPAPGPSLPIRVSAKDQNEAVVAIDGIGGQTLMAPGPDGGLYVSIPRPGGGTILVLLDRGGTPRPGWPLAFGQSSACALLLPLADGSVRLACRPDNPDATLWLFALDASGRSIAGWPVNLGAGSLYAGRMIGEELTILTGAVVSPDGAQEVWITSIGVDGIPHRGVRAAIAGFAGMGHDYRTGSSNGEWAIGPDGVAYGTFQAFANGSTPKEAYAKAKSALFAVGSGGIAAGFPVAITGWASQPAFDGAGRIHLVVGSLYAPPTRLLVFDTGGRAASGDSGALEVTAPADSMSIGASGHLAPPLVGADGTRFVVGGELRTSPAGPDAVQEYSPRQDTVIAIGPSGQPLTAGWPYRSVGLQVNFICPPQAACDGVSFAARAIGPDNVLYLLQSARFSATGPSGGGSIVAIGTDGQVRAGWPRTLKRAGSGFWKLVVGADGTAFALAIERESAGYSATILAIAPDATVRYATTIVEP